MEWKTLRTSVVVIAKEHNPTILHPSFLESQEIVPRDWESEKIICTPPYSLVKYKNGISFEIDNIRLRVLQEPAPTDVSSSLIPKLVVDYITKLPHVPYSAVGINFDSILVNSEPEKYLINRFISKGPWNEGETLLKSVAIRFVYPIENAILNLSCQPGVSKLEKEQESSGIIINANYHLDLTPDKALEEAKRFILGFQERYSHLKKLITRIFSEGEKDD